MCCLWPSLNAELDLDTSQGMDVLFAPIDLRTCCHFVKLTLRQAGRQVAQRYGFNAVQGAGQAAVVSSGNPAGLSTKSLQEMLTCPITQVCSEM